MSVIRERIEDLRNAVQSWIEWATDYDAIDDDQYKPGPVNRAYFTYTIIAGLTRTALTQDALELDETTGKWNKVGTRNITVSIKSRGLPPKGSTQRLLRATDMLAELEWSLDKPETKAIFERHGVTLISAEPIVETSLVENATLMPRAAMDIKVALTIKEPTTTQSIEKFILSGSLETGKEGELHEVDPITISIPGGE